MEDEQRGNSLIEADNAQVPPQLCCLFLSLACNLKCPYCINLHGYAERVQRIKPQKMDGAVLDCCCQPPQFER